MGVRVQVQVQVGCNPVKVRLLVRAKPNVGRTWIRTVSLMEIVVEF